MNEDTYWHHRRFSFANVHNYSNRYKANELDVLLLDDLGTEGGMKKNPKSVRQDMQEMLFRVANARLDFNRNEPVHSTISTTNLSTKKLAGIYNEKIISRLVPHNRSQIVDFDGLNDVRK